MLGDVDGISDGRWDGLSLGDVDGLLLGGDVGVLDGDSEGTVDGVLLGNDVGIIAGETLGLFDGAAVELHSVIFIYVLIHFIHIYKRLYVTCCAVRKTVTRYICLYTFIILHE